MPSEIIIDLWNVGQGDATSITLPSGELILIDVGPRNSSLSRWLHQKPPVRIKEIILTHNDSDHVGALSSIIKALHDKIDRILFLQDKDIKDFVSSDLFRTTFEYFIRKEINVSRLETDNCPKIIWEDASSGIRLLLRYPNIFGNALRRSPNDASAILSLESRDHVYIVWAGDAPLERVSEVCKNLNPELLFGPHHGAPIDKMKKSTHYKNYIKKINPKRCFISVGTGNQYSHPDVKYIKGLDSACCSVACSQVTAKCDAKRSFYGKSVMNTSGYYGLPSPFKGCSCRGHIRIKISDTTFIDDEFAEKHLELVKSINNPKCLSYSKYAGRI